MQMTRRGMMMAAGATVAAAMTPRAFAAWQPNQRYPDPAIQTLDPAFNKYRIAQSTVERIATGCRWNRFDGKSLNSPTDVVLKSDDSIWFTDPPSGILGNYEGHVATPELPTNVYRLDPKSGQATVVAGGDYRPNGIAFSPDESRCYIVNASAVPREILVYDVAGNGMRLANRRTFIAVQPGDTPDGFRVDLDGNLWCGWGMSPDQDGVKVFDNTGKPIGFIALPERAANLCFGGPKRNRLFMAASHSVYSLYVNTQGVKGG